MDDCKCYREQLCYKSIYNNDGQRVGQYPYINSYCTGTRECEECTCQGNTSLCNFYPEKRKEKKMTTADMWTLAQKNNKVYVADDMAYSKKYGFTSAYDFTDEWKPENFDSIEDIMTINNWEEMSNIMTKEEAEEKFNIHIV